MATCYQRDWARPPPHACRIWFPTAHLCWCEWQSVWGKFPWLSSRTINEGSSQCADGNSYWKILCFTDSTASKVHTRQRHLNPLRCTVRIVDGATFSTNWALVTACPKNRWSRKSETFLGRKNWLGCKSLCEQRSITRLLSARPLQNTGNSHAQLGFMVRVDAMITILTMQ